MPLHLGHADLFNITHRHYACHNGKDPLDQVQKDRTEWHDVVRGKSGVLVSAIPAMIAITSAMKICVERASFFF